MHDHPHAHRCGEPPQHATTPQGRAFSSFMHTLHAHRQHMVRRFAEQGIHTSQAFALREVAHNDGITQRDLAELLNISRPTLTVTLQKMEKAGLIERRADETDSRYIRIHLTEAGATMHDRMHEIMFDVVGRTMKGISEEDLSHLERLMDQMRANITDPLETNPQHPSPPETSR